nr:UTP--glucose-1-phosphate uridylyltransferase [Anaerolineae bacterium]
LPRALGKATAHNFFGPLQTIIPWASNAFTERIIAHAKATFGDDFWGFWMLGGMSGGGMGFIVAPHQQTRAKDELLHIMQETKREMQHALPFAMEPVVYDFAINEHGTFADLLSGPVGGPAPALMPSRYYTLTVPALVKRERAELSNTRRSELAQFAHACQNDPAFAGVIEAVFDRLLPRPNHNTGPSANAPSLNQLLQNYGFDRVQHEHIRDDLRAGRIGLAQNRLPASSTIEDVRPGDVTDATRGLDSALAKLGRKAIQNGEVAVVTLAAGAGSRWTQGAGVVKALHPFCKLGGRHRSFIEVHLAKTQRVMQQFDASIPHIFTTSYATHEPIQAALQTLRTDNSPLRQHVYLSPGRSVGLRVIPMARDLHFAYEEMPQQLLDEQAQKMRASVHAALINWARSNGEGNDYTDNVPSQCLHPVGHWPEVPNLLRNGVLQQLLTAHPNLQYLMLHNVDTVGATVDAGLLGWHIANRKTLSFEVIERLIEDRGGGLARVDGQLRIVESLAMPREEDEFKLSYYNSMTTWISIDGLLRAFGLTRAELGNHARVDEAVRVLAQRMPTYITLKDVKKRWGNGQEDILPVTQWEKLWSDMSALPDLDCGFIAVPRVRGQQLKDQAQLDGWLRDGSADYVLQLMSG